MKRTSPTARLLTRCVAPFVLGGVLLAACGSDEKPDTTVDAPTRIVVTSVKGDPASQLLSAIYARALEDSGFAVARRDAVSMDRAAYYQAVQDGSIQLIPDWTGDLLHFLYAETDSGSAPTTVVPTAPATTQAPITIPTTTVAETTTTGATGDTTGDTTADTTGDTASATTDETTTTEETTTTVAETTTTGEATTTTEVQNGRTVVEQLVFIRSALADTVAINNGVQAENKTVIACTKDAVEANSGTQFLTLTDLASVAPNIRLGGSAAWNDDEEQGYAALQLFYGGDYKSVETIEDDALAAAIDDGDVDCVAMNSLNSLITTKSMRIMVDDKSMIVGNTAIALLNADIATPDLIGVLDNLSATLTTERLNQMLNQIADGTDPVVVANAFIDSL